MPRVPFMGLHEKFCTHILRCFVSFYQAQPCYRRSAVSKPIARAHSSVRTPLRFCICINLTIPDTETFTPPLPILQEEGSTQEDTRTYEPRSTSNDIEKRRVWIRISYPPLWSSKDFLMMRRRTWFWEDFDRLRCERSSRMNTATLGQMTRHMKHRVMGFFIRSFEKQRAT